MFLISEVTLQRFNPWSPQRTNENPNPELSAINTNHQLRTLDPTTSSTRNALYGYLTCKKTNPLSTLP